jgi:hypothetical protein
MAFIVRQKEGRSGYAANKDRKNLVLGGKANAATSRVPCALHQMGFGCPCVSQR